MWFSGSFRGSARDSAFHRVTRRKARQPTHITNHIPTAENELMRTHVAIKASEYQQDSLQDQALRTAFVSYVPMAAHKTHVLL